MNLEERLDALQLTAEQKEGVRELFYEGFDITVKPDNFVFESKSINITNKAADGQLLQTCYLDVEIEGIDRLMIKSVRLPAIDYSSTELFEVDVTLLPKCVANEMRKFTEIFSKKVQSGNEVQSPEISQENAHG